VKMRLERPAGRDKREIKIILPLKISRASAEDIQNRFFSANAQAGTLLWALSMIPTKNRRKNWMVILKGIQHKTVKL